MVVASLPQATLRSRSCPVAGWAACLQLPGRPDQSPGAMALSPVLRVSVGISGPRPGRPLTREEPGSASASLGSWLMPAALALPTLGRSWDRAYLWEVRVLEAPVRAGNPSSSYRGTESREGFCLLVCSACRSSRPRALGPHGRERVWPGRRDVQAGKATCPSCKGSGDGWTNLLLSVKDSNPR